MTEKQPWQKFWPEAAKQFSEASVGHRHLAEILPDAASRFGERPAVSTQLPNGACATLNFNEIEALTADFAVWLREIAGVQAGDTVALMSPNCCDFLVAAFGIFTAGCVCTNVNPLYTAPEVEHQLKDSGAKVLVIADLFGDKAETVVNNTSVEHVVTLSLADFFPPLKKALMGFVLKRVKKVIPVLTIPHVTMAEALKGGGAHRAANGIDASGYHKGQALDSVAVYQYTGGTTGRSKGAELSHRNILFNAAATVSLIEETMGEDGGDCSIVALPLYHITAFALVMMPSLVKGSHLVMIPSPRPPVNLKPAFEKHRITHFSGINTLFAALLEEPWCTRETLKDLKLCSSGGAAQLVAVAQRWEELTGLPIYQGYGLTECAGCLTLNPYGANRPGYAGVPIPLTDIRITDDDGNELPRGSAGEVVARGPTIMQRYLNQPEISDETLKDGWLHTGDIGIMDEDGYLQIVDRKKDMILVSGFNVYPNEVEDVIARLDGVVEVGVVGVPDEKMGESVKAFVVSSDPDLSAGHIRDFCESSLTNYKRPREIEFVAEIPKTPVGKVLRRNLRELKN
jgi:long-chain acyl-CoA synthetase